MDPGWLPRLLKFHADLFRRAGRVAGPVWDLAVRIGLAQPFFVAGLATLEHGHASLALSHSALQGSWIDLTSSTLGTGIELLCPILLIVGLFTRLVSIPLMILTLVAQSADQAHDRQLLTAALLGWQMIGGAGPLSLDALLRRGLGDSALAMAAVVRAAGWLRLRGVSLYLSALRVWLAAAWLLPIVAAPTPAAGVAHWLPIRSASGWPFNPLIAAAAGSLMLLGLGTRYVALLLIVLLLSAALIQLPHDCGLYLAAVLAALLLFGGGLLGADSALMHFFKRRFPSLDGTVSGNLEGLPRVVIVGAGFGGLTCAQALRRAPVSVTLIDRGNYHLFQPLLYQVATAGLSPGDIAAPIRSLFRDCFNTRVLLGTVTGIDTVARQVLLPQQQIPYDYLVLATGATHSYFGKDEWEPYAPGLKTIEDATAIRSKLLSAFERAEATDDAVERTALLTFLIVGAGPTGIELAGALSELARHGMEKEFRRFDPATARVLLLEAGPRVLPAFDVKLAAIAQRSLQRMGVEVLLGSKVEQIDAQGVCVAGRRIAARTVIWAAGVAASAAGKWLACATDGAGRIKVTSDLGVPGHDNVFAIGDTALSMSWNQHAAPGLAPAAKQEGAFIAKLIRARISGERGPGKFVYRHMGSLATIGRQSAVADFGRFKLWGAPAWWFWGLIHIGFLVGMRNRAATMLNWFWSYLTYDGGIRLITGDDREDAPREPDHQV